MTDIKVGDTVRIKADYPYTSGGNNAGTEFEVKGVVRQRWSGAFFYVTGDPADFGVWAQYIEKVGPNGADRWRYNDHIVVYPETRDENGPGRGVTILDETPLPKIYTRWENQSDTLARLDDEITEAARAYWAAHPLPKPAWHSARPGEVWIVDADIITWEGPQAMMVAIDNIFHNPSWSFPVEDGDITSARRIYPEQTA